MATQETELTGFSVRVVVADDDAGLTEDQLDALLDAFAELGVTSPVVSTGDGSIDVRLVVDHTEDPAHAASLGEQLVVDAFTKAAIVDRRWVAGVEAFTWDQLERELEAFNVELVGVTEVAELLGVTRQRASELRTRRGFPAPLADLAAGPVWRRGDVMSFVQTWERKPGRLSRVPTLRVAATSSLGEVEQVQIRRGGESVGVFATWELARADVIVGDEVIVYRPNGITAVFDATASRAPVFGAFELIMRYEVARSAGP